MQEEIENRTVSLVVSTTQVSARVLLQALQRYLNRADQRKQVRANEHRQIRMTRTLEKEKIITRSKLEGPHGKQSVKQITRSGKEVKRLPVQAEHLREFEKVCRKYGVDFAVTKGMYEGQSRYLVFFKAKDEALLSDVYRECIAKQLHKRDRARKPSVLKSLAQFKAIAARTPHKLRQKELTR